MKANCLDVSPKNHLEKVKYKKQRHIIINCKFIVYNLEKYQKLCIYYYIHIYSIRTVSDIFEYICKLKI